MPKGSETLCTQEVNHSDLDNSEQRAIENALIKL